MMTSDTSRVVAASQGTKGTAYHHLHYYGGAPLLRKNNESVKWQKRRYDDSSLIVHVYWLNDLKPTLKNGNYAASNDSTYEGCTAVMTPFASPYLVSPS